MRMKIAACGKSRAAGGCTTTHRKRGKVLVTIEIGNIRQMSVGLAVEARGGRVTRTPRIMSLR